jgi:hypothetical protein
MAVLGPKRPLHRPKPTEVACENGNFIYLDGNEVFQSGTELFVCIDEDTNQFELLDDGHYKLLDGTSFEVSSNSLV